MKRQRERERCDRERVELCVLAVESGVGGLYEYISGFELNENICSEGFYWFLTMNICLCNVSTYYGLLDIPMMFLRLQPVT